MNHRRRYALLSTYRTPTVRIGQRVECQVRGTVRIRRLADSRIPWPWATTVNGAGSGAGPVVFRDLERAVRRESNQAVSYWFGVTGQIVTKWRRALGVPETNEGTRKRRAEYARTSPAMKRARRKAWAKARDPKRRAKIAASRRGKPRPEVIEKMRQANLGRKLSKSHRLQLSQAHLRRGTRPPKAGRPWSAREQALLRKLPPKLVAARTGRTLKAVYSARRALGLPDGRSARSRDGA
jgi:hypothetical protein